jgi:signal transduction histidine kinase
MISISRSLLKSLLIAVIAAGLTLILANLSFFSLLELKGLDLLFALRGTLPPPKQIVVVAIDETSLAEIKRQWPWPRSIHAQLIQRLNKAGAKVIGFDVLFAEPSNLEEDTALEHALQDAGNVVLVSALAVVNDPLFRLTTRIDPLPALAKVAGVGGPIITIDGDGVVRRSRLLYPGMSSFALQIVGKYLSAPERKALSKLDLTKDVIINYPGPPRTITTVSYYQALDYERLLPPGIFEDKIVLVGRSLETIPEPQNLSGDTFLTPFSWVSGNAAAGVEIQAALIGNFLQGGFVTELSKPVQIALVLTLILVASLLLVKLKPVFALFAIGAIAGVFLVTAHVVFSNTAIWLPIISGTMGLGLFYVGYLLAGALMAERERRRTLEEANRNLEAKIAERTQELSNANQELGDRHQQLERAYNDLAHAQEQLIQSEKMASLGLLVAGIAHELNNPISFVHSNLEFIEEYTERLVKIVLAYSDLNKSDSEKRRRGDEQKETEKFEILLDKLRRLITSCRMGAERVKQIVLDLRTFSRTDDVGLVMTSLQVGIESTLNLLTREYKDRIIVHRNYGCLPEVECYPGQINQVFMNLLQNAAQAIPEKGEVWIRTEYLGDWVKIVIKDNGVGISAKDLDRIFDPFFTTKPVGQGTGLGLSITYGIVQKHGGKISAISKLNEGTEFNVELPVRINRKSI